MELVKSIKEHGLINPIAVRPDGLIIAGEQRWRAAKVVPLERVPVTVRDADIWGTELLRIAENLRRRNVSVVETIKATRRERDVRQARILADRQAISGSDVFPGKTTEPDTKSAEIAARREMIAARNGPGSSEAATRELDKLGDLVPALLNLLGGNRPALSRNAGYQLAQLPPE